MSKIEDKIIEKIQKRAELGLSKYGVTMEREDLTQTEWLQHLQDELLDAAIYAQKLKEIEASRQRGVIVAKALLTNSIPEQSVLALPEFLTNYHFIEFLEEKLKQGWQVLAYSKSFKILDENGDVKYSGSTLRECLANFVLGGYE